MTVHPILSLRGAKRLRPFCHCEPERRRRSGSQSIFYIIGFASFLLKDEIATGSPAESPRNDRGVDCHASLREARNDKEGVPAFGGQAMTLENLSLKDCQWDVAVLGKFKIFLRFTMGGRDLCPSRPNSLLYFCFTLAL